MGGFLEPRIYVSTLGRSVLIIRAGELGTIDYQGGTEDDFAALNRRLKPVAFPDADCRAKLAWQSHLPFALNFNESGHTSFHLIYKDRKSGNTQPAPAMYIYDTYIHETRLIMATRNLRQRDLGGMRTRIVRTKLKQIKAIKDENIDYSDIPETDADFWRRAELHMPEPKKGVYVRLDADILAWLKSKGRGYQTRMNAMLRTLMESDRRRA